MTHPVTPVETPTAFSRLSTKEHGKPSRIDYADFIEMLHSLKEFRSQFVQVMTPFDPSVAVYIYRLWISMFWRHGCRSPNDSPCNTQALISQRLLNRPGNAEVNHRTAASHNPETTPSKPKKLKVKADLKPKR